jgi:hypothetical protein
MDHSPSRQEDAQLIKYYPSFIDRTYTPKIQVLIKNMWQQTSNSVHQGDGVATRAAGTILVGK